jgi:hypothetical protein
VLEELQQTVSAKVCKYLARAKALVSSLVKITRSSLWYINARSSDNFLSCAATCLPKVWNSSSLLTLSIELSLDIALSIGVILGSDVDDEDDLWPS